MIRQPTEGRTSTATAPEYTEIVVPLDGSPAAELVLPHASALAVRFGARMTLVRVTPPPEVSVVATPTAPFGTRSGELHPLIEREREDAIGYLDTLARHLKAAGIAVTFEHRDGSAAAEILELARMVGADLIAMTTHGRGGLGRLVFGSVAYDVVRAAPCPVLIVRVSAEQTADRPAS